MAQQDSQSSKNVHPGGGVAFGITSLITGIISVLAGLIFWISLPLATIAIVFGVLGLKKADSRGLAIAGLVTGVVGAFIGIAIAIVAVVALTAGAPSVPEYQTPPQFYTNY